jgi:GNAT superfamily N-acetyltransferase
MSPTAFIVEPATDDDINFIRSSWMRSFADSSWARGAGPAYWAGHKEIRDRLLDECPPVVARLEGLPTSICGWACFAPDVVHYVYVRERWQRNGVASLLLEPFADKSRVFFTHKTSLFGTIPREGDVRDTLGHKLNVRGWIYNPYMALVAPRVRAA